MRDISRWIDRHAEFTPEKTALCFEGSEIRYSDLASEVANTAAALKHGFGIGRGDRVAFLGLNGPEFIRILFACARLGALFIPLNWRLAPPELAFILKNATAKLLVCEPEFTAQMANLKLGLPDCTFAALGTVPEGWESFADARLAATGDDSNPHVDGTTPLLLVYTSGTTGKPKGAVLTQDAVQWNAFNSLHMHDMTSADRILTVLPMFHVGGLNIQTTPALYTGATVILHRRFEPRAVLEAIENDRPTLLVLVPATIAALISEKKWDDADLGSLRAITTGSSIVPLPIIRAVHTTGIPVLQVYGSTETGPVSTYLKAADAMANEGSAGKTALHGHTRVVDDTGKDVPSGESGEIWVKGPNVMYEYWGDDEATRNAFEDGWFKTGDVGYWDPDGHLYVNDRKKDVVISGGENIYPAELESVLAETPGIAEAAVVGRPDERWGEVAVAVVVPRPDAGLNTESVLDCFEGRLAKFKHPKDVMFIDALPRNVMGKVQKSELRSFVTGGSAIDLTDD